MSEIRPLIAESSTAESSQVQIVLSDLIENSLVIPDYQRDSNQWDEQRKSLFIESVINNLTIPAFFFEVSHENGMEINEVVDGQQRLTTLSDFFSDKFSLVPADEAPYISPNSVHYAGKKYSQLPVQYQKSFRNYRLSIIKLRNLGDMKLEIFRRINQGGTPLSGQDIRLAYYGSESPSMTFIRLVGIYDVNRTSSKRIIESEQTKKQGLIYPWNEARGKFWNQWWDAKEISHGQAPSEMFLWSLVSVYHVELNNLVQNSTTLGLINCRYHNTIEEALDAFCGYLNYQDRHPESPKLLIELNELKGSFADFFMIAVSQLLIINLPVIKHRLIASVIGNLYRMNRQVNTLSSHAHGRLIDFIRKPQDAAEKILGEYPNGNKYPLGKGRWAGAGGYFRQFQVIKEIINKIVNDECV